jgi:hypothetical protein
LRSKRTSRRTSDEDPRDSLDRQARVLKSHKQSLLARLAKKNLPEATRVEMQEEFELVFGALEVLSHKRVALRGLQKRIAA